MYSLDYVDIAARS